MTEVADNTVVDGRYRILGRVGSGGMADVYRAEDTHLGREVALKVLHRRFAQDQEFVERFRREAKSAAGLQHPHVVGVFDRGEHDGTYYIAMEYLQGRTLKEIVNTQAPLPQETVIDLGLQILAAAGFAHRHQVIHRDFKPHNVIVDDAWQAKVTDFGIARAGASEMTETGSIMGTAQYLSPEQAQGHAVGATSDIYSIGVMLYEMLTGRVPFEGDSAVAVALKHLSEPPTPISHLRPDVHPTLESVVMAALAKDPAQRWQTAEEFAAALSTARDQIASGATAPRDTAEFAAAAVLPVAASNGDSPPPPREPEEERRWPWFTIGILALALLALLGFLAVSGILSADKKEVPRVVGKQLIQARQQVEKAGFKVATERVKSPADLDEVVDQDPNAGDQADEGSTVTLVVSNGPGNALVPSVEGQTRSQAIKNPGEGGLRRDRELGALGNRGGGHRDPHVPAAGHVRGAEQPGDAQGEQRSRAGGGARRHGTVARLGGGHTHRGGTQGLGARRSPRTSPRTRWCRRIRPRAPRWTQARGSRSRCPPAPSRWRCPTWWASGPRTRWAS